MCFFAGADVIFPVFVANVSINGFGDIRYDSGICFRIFRRIFDEDGDGIAGAVRQDDESQVVGPGEDASFVAVARAGFVSDDGAGSRQWFRKTVGTCFTVYQVLPDHFPQSRSENLFCYEQLQQSGRFERRTPVFVARLRIVVHLLFRCCDCEIAQSKRPDVAVCRCRTARVLEEDVAGVVVAQLQAVLQQTAD